MTTNAHDNERRTDSHHSRIGMESVLGGRERYPSEPLADFGADYIWEAAWAVSETIERITRRERAAWEAER